MNFLKNSFNTVTNAVEINKLKDKLKDLEKEKHDIEIEKNNKFIKVRKIVLEDDKFPIYFSLNRDYVRFGPEKNTPGEGVRWGDSFKYYSSEPKYLIWRGSSNDPVSRFFLVNKEMI